MQDYLKMRDGQAREREQMDRQHILMVNQSPAFLDFVRVALGEARYNVTTTNAVPLTFDLIAAARPALIIVDLAITEQSGWDLLVRLHTEATTATIPVIITATDDRLLAHAQHFPYLFGGETKLVVPFTVAALHQAVDALIGPA